MLPKFFLVLSSRLTILRRIVFICNSNYLKHQKNKKREKQRRRKYQVYIIVTRCHKMLEGRASSDMCCAMPYGVMSYTSSHIICCYIRLWLYDSLQSEHYFTLDTWRRVIHTQIKPHHEHVQFSLPAVPSAHSARAWHRERTSWWTSHRGRGRPRTAPAPKTNQNKWNHFEANLYKKWCKV